MKELLTTWYGEVVLLAAVSVVLMGLKRLLQRWWPRRLYLVDFLAAVVTLFYAPLNVTNNGQFVIAVRSHVANDFRHRVDPARGT